MLSKRNLAMMMMMCMIVLVLFLSAVVLKEYFNDYDVNHAAKTQLIEKKEQTTGIDEGKKELGNSGVPREQIVYVGAVDNGYYDVMKEWVEYRKKSFQTFASLDAMEGEFLINDKQKTYLLVDGELLESNVSEATETLSEYVEQGAVVVFYRLPSYQAINGCAILQDLLGIQQLRAESVTLYEIRLYGGFLLGGETCYSFEGVKYPELIDMDRDVPWYDISSRTKSYMVGFLSAAEKASMSLENEDMPAIIWRSSLGKGSVFAVNGDYMKGEDSLGILDAILYESESYALYSVVNAQNLSVAGFPALTKENEQIMEQTYGMTNVQFCRDVLWPSLVAGAQKQNWKISSFLSVKQSEESMNEANKGELIEYLKYFNEESAEAGVSLGRMDSTDIRLSVEEDKETLKSWNLKYAFTGGYIRSENKDKLPLLIDDNGKMDFFEDIRTVVGEYEKEEKILGWLSDQITLQNATTNASRHSYRDSVRLKSLETSLGYSNILIDIYAVLWPENVKDEWQEIAEKIAANIDTYWKPFAAFEKTTISESDRRVRNFLNGSVESSRNENQISIQTKDFTGDAYLLLRTHGEEPEQMTGGTWKKVEEDAYLLQITSDKVSVTLKPEIESHYQY